MDSGSGLVFNYCETGGAMDYELNAEPGAYAITGAPAELVLVTIFALVQPYSFTVETQPPAEALHPPSNHHDPVAAGSEYVGVVLMVVVILIGGWRTIVRLVRL